MQTRRASRAKTRRSDRTKHKDSRSASMQKLQCWIRMDRPNAGGRTLLIWRRYRIRTYDFHPVNETSIGKQRSYWECSVMLGNIESTN